jgi:DNA-binding response OmpR family regulator
MRVILFADNDADFLNTRTEFLEKAGYRVLKAHTLEQARQQLSEAHVHVAILDVRMEDDDDPQDISGLVLAKDPTYRVVPKIILTGRAHEYGIVREALRALPEGYPPAVDFVAKQEGPEVLIEAIERAFAEQVRINWDLNIRWGRQNELSSPYLVSLVAPDLPREQLADRSAELEDALRKLFYDYQQVTLGRILTRRPGWVLLTAFAYRPQGQEEQFALAWGRREDILADRAGHESLPQATRRTLNLAKSAETMRWGAIAYRLVDCEEIEEVTTFTRFYHQQPAGRVAATVTDLFQTTLHPWYARGREKRDRSVETLCREWLGSEGWGVSQPELERRIASLSRATLSSGLLADLACLSNKVSFRFSTGQEFSCPNPLPHLFGERLATRPPTQCGTIHGRLDGASILVDRSGRTWVVDFGKVGPGPLLWDFVFLESSVRFDMMKEADLAARHELEARLLAQRRLDDPVDSEGLTADAEKALQTIRAIRGQAGRAVGPEIEPYLMGLLFCAQGRLLDYRPEWQYTRGELVTYVHAFLLLSMVCQRLAVLEDRLQQLPPQAARSLWLDEGNQEVWVEGRCVALTPQEFRLLKYLYDHANLLCRREALAEHVFDLHLSGLHPEQAKEVMRDTINSAIRRLREEIEPDPDHPTYIQTVRGSGYKLVLPDVSS